MRFRGTLDIESEQAKECIINFLNRSKLDSNVTKRERFKLLRRRRKTAQVLNLSSKIGRIFDAGKECLCVRFNL